MLSAKIVGVFIGSAAYGGVMGWDTKRFVVGSSVALILSFWLIS